MKEIIVTVKDVRDSFIHDMEIPTDVPMNLVIKEMTDNLMMMHRSLTMFQGRFKVQCSRTGKYIVPGKTAEECGIWNGDYLVFSEV